MLNLKAIRHRAETRASVANPANPANWLTESDQPTPPISQLATLATLAGQIRPGQACANCRHRSRVGTCREPVASGLTTTFEIHWPEPGYGATCTAWTLSPVEATVAVLTAAGRGGWSDELMHQWLKDADAYPEATLDALRNGAPT